MKNLTGNLIKKLESLGCKVEKDYDPIYKGRGIAFMITITFNECEYLGLGKTAESALFTAIHYCPKELKKQL